MSFSAVVTPFQFSTTETWTTPKFNQGFNPTISVTGNLEALTNWNTVSAVSKTFTATDLVNDVLTTVAHGLTTGQALTVANSGGGLPAGLVAATTYYARTLTADTFSLHYTSAGATAATARVDITTAGSGTQTATWTVFATGKPLIFNAGTSKWETGIVTALNLPEFVGATASAPGTRGAVPQPGPADTAKFLKADGTWATPSSAAVLDLFLCNSTS
jgi:hypothetical protein